MDEQTYLDERVEDQIHWLGRKSAHNQRWFKRFRLVELIAAALIPFLTGLIEQVGVWMSVVVGSLGVVVVTVAALIGLFKLQENWISYRTTAEHLKREKYLYLTHTPPYASHDRLIHLVQRVEGLLTDERADWADHTQRTAQPGEGAA